MPEVQSIDTHAMSREKLVQEIRTLESELEYTHEKNLKQEEELDILKGVMEELQERRQQDEAGGANTGIELPARSGKLEDVLLADPGGTVVTVVDGQLHSIIVDCRDILDSAAQVAVLYDELESRYGRVEGACTGPRACFLPLPRTPPACLRGHEAKGWRASAPTFATIRFADPKSTRCV